MTQRDRHKRWVLANPEAWRKHQQKYRSRPEVKLRRALQERARRALKRAYSSPVSPIDELLGCTPEQAAAHIERLFKPGMSWENYGKWQVDHVRPVCSFDLDDPEQRKECFHYSNLQPLWAEENLLKGRKNA